MEHSQPSPPIGINSDLTQRAARGDLSAQRELRDQFFAGQNHIAIDAPLALVLCAETMPYARLCAAQGDVSDLKCLAAALCFTFEASQTAGYGRQADILAGEALAILERLAEDGDEDAATAANGLVDLQPGVAVIARRLLKVEN